MEVQVMKTFTLAASAALLFTLAGCSDSNDPGDGTTITLTASQAATLVSRIEFFGASDPTLSSLADTVDVVLTAGAVARRVEIVNSQGASSFYAVSLQRTHQATAGTPGATSWSTFNIIAFDDPTNPTLFVILGGFNSVASGPPPNTVTGPIGATSSSSLTGHLFSVSGNQVSTWNASGGTSYMTVGATSETCAGFTGPGTCVKSTMDASFTITGSVAGNGTTGERTWSGNITSIPGISLSM
jgi:hypothetical protein